MTLLLKIWPVQGRVLPRIVRDDGPGGSRYHRIAMGKSEMLVGDRGMEIHRPFARPRLIVVEVSPLLH